MNLDAAGSERVLDRLRNSGRRGVLLRYPGSGECSVCLSELHHRRVMHLPCGHPFHVACFRKFYRDFRLRRCPNCRQHIPMLRRTRELDESERDESEHDESEHELFSPPQSPNDGPDHEFWVENMLSSDAVWDAHVRDALEMYYGTPTSNPFPMDVPAPPPHSPLHVRRSLIASFDAATSPVRTPLFRRRGRAIRNDVLAADSPPPHDDGGNAPSFAAGAREGATPTPSAEEPRRAASAAASAVQRSAYRMLRRARSPA